MQSVKSIAWLAGILEGEGYFGFNGDSSKIKLKMTDRDTITKVALMFKRPMYEEKIPLGNKQAYRVTICGSPAIEWMFTIYPLMSYRRQAKIREIVSQWKEAVSYSVSIFTSCGHPKSVENTAKYGKYTKCRICSRAQNNRAKDERRKVKWQNEILLETMNR